MFIIELIILAALGYAGYTAYRTYVDLGNTISPLDQFVSTFLSKLLRK